MMMVTVNTTSTTLGEAFSCNDPNRVTTPCAPGEEEEGAVVWPLAVPHPNGACVWTDHSWSV